MRLPERPARTRLLGGVCVGLADWLRVDVTLVRLAFMLLTLAWGAGLVLYLLGWVLLPEAGAPVAGGPRRVIRRNLSSLRGDLRRSGSHVSAAWQRSGHRQRWPRPLSRRWVALGLVIAGLAVVLSSFGAFGWLTPTRAVGVAAVALGASVLATVEG
jgi:phage shock protein PspC (stress-responsive transcriptional regulator)